MIPNVLSLLLLFFFGVAHSQELRYALFTSGPTGSFDSSGAVPAIELAEELINADSSILPGYNLTHTPVVDVKCDRTVSLNEYFNVISPPNPTILGLLGCGCSVASTPVAEIIHHNSISQVSYISSLTELNDKSRFPNFFRTYPSDADFAPAIVTLIQEYGWRRIAFITQDESLFAQAFMKLRAPLRRAGISMDNREISSLLPMAKETIKRESFFFEEDDYRVFFINTYSAICRQIICEAYMRGYTHPKYVWLTYGWYQDRWWTEEVNPEPTNCTDHQLAEVLHRSLALQLIPNLNDLNTTTDTGLTPREFDSHYQMRINTPEAQANNYTSVFFATVAFDALWMFALALNSTSEMVQSSTRQGIANLTGCNVPGELVPLENFTYSNQFMGCVIRWNLERTDFVGVSERVKFDSTGSRLVEQVEFFQYRMKRNSFYLFRAYFGFSKKSTNVSEMEFFYKKDENINTVYHRGVPRDGSEVPQFLTYHLALIVPYYILATAGLVFCTVCLVFNFTQRNKKVVKITSPNINYFIIVGCYFNYLSIYFRIIPSTEYDWHVLRCFSDSLLTTIGYSLAFSAILVKMGRVYYIFHNPSLSKKTLSDWKLVLIATCISSIGVLLSIIQVSVPVLQPFPAPLNITNGPRRNRNELGDRVNQMVHECFSTTIQTIFLIVVFAFMTILQIIGIVLAIQTRKIKIKLLNDSKYIAAVIYICSVSLAFIAVVTLVPGIYINIIEGVFSGSVVTANTFFLALIFIPKMISLYRDPEGENVLTTGGNALNTNERNVNFVSKEVTTRMRERIVQLETILKECHCQNEHIIISHHLDTQGIDESNTGSLTTDTTFTSVAFDTN